MDWPLYYLKSFGPAADPLTRIGWGTLWISIIVMIVIAAMLLAAIFRRRAPVAPDEEGLPPIARSPGGLRFITIGVGISTLVLFGVTIWMFQTLAAVARPSHEPLVSIEVIGKQWWWEVRYLNGDNVDFVTANEIHIPVGQPVRVKLTGFDVIHSFWVPQLAGKMDIIPGRDNRTWLQADRAGTYRGQCMEYCGAQHARMAFEVVAQGPQEFDAWRERQRKPAAHDEPAATVAGRDLFATRCGACHTVRGTQARGTIGPDLTHVMSRAKIAAGMLPNDRAYLEAWVADAQAFKPGVLMPRQPLAGNELVGLVDYLGTLQ